MIGFVLTLLGSALALIITANLVPGFRVNSFEAALIGAVVLGFVNAIVRPIITILTLPLTILTLGLFLFVVNAIAFWIMTLIAPGITVSGFGAALIGSIVLTIVSTIISWIARSFDLRRG